MESDFLPLISQIANKKFGIFAVKPFQMLVMQRILEQENCNIKIRNQLVILPTGTGKSLCFLLPALLCKGITVIVYPLLALMNDQINRLKTINIESVCLRGGQTNAQREDVFRQLKKVKILITNPETICNYKILTRLSDFQISLFVCDEAHVIESWGKTFRPSYMKLQNIIEKLCPKQILAFTATADNNTLNTILNCLFPPVKKNESRNYLFDDPLIVRGDSDRENIFYSSFYTSDRETGLYTILEKCAKPALVFCNTRSLTRILCLKGKRMYPNIKQLYYHAGLNKTERTLIEKIFFKSSDGILYTTNAYGMGIDKPNIRTVIHYILPQNALSYLQESGRAGRDGKTSYAFALITNDEILSFQKHLSCQNSLQTNLSVDNKTRTCKDFSVSEKSAVNTISVSQRDWFKSVFIQKNCRRQALLSLLGENKKECCGCDYCIQKNIFHDEISTLVFKMVKHYPLRFNFKTLSEYLCSENSNLKEKVKINSSVFPYFKIDLVEKTIKKLTEDTYHPDRPFRTIRTFKQGLLLYLHKKHFFRIKSMY